MGQNSGSVEQRTDCTLELESGLASLLAFCTSEFSELLVFHLVCKMRKADSVYIEPFQSNPTTEALAR